MIDTCARHRHMVAIALAIWRARRGITQTSVQVGPERICSWEFRRKLLPQKPSGERRRAPELPRQREKSQASRKYRLSNRVADVVFGGFHPIQGAVERGAHLYYVR